MAQKAIAVILNNFPASSALCPEGLRAAIGLASGFDEHKISIILTGDGTWLALKTLDRSVLGKYLISLKALEVPIYADRKKVMDLGLSEADIAEDVTLLESEQIKRTLQTTDLVLTL
ncbi:MAG: DsrE family protein [bacterium]